MFTAHASQRLEQRQREARYNDDDLELLEFPNYVNDNQIRQMVRSTFPVCRIDQVHVVNHRQMYGMYLLRKEEMAAAAREGCGTGVDELVLYHSTTESRALLSLEHGLDWRRTRRSKFGRGVSFSDDADYANFYADNRTPEDDRVMMVCAVLVARTHRLTKKTNGDKLDTPPVGADTTVSPNGRVYVKYNDFEFYPLYLVYYRRRPEDLSKSRYFNGSGGPNYQAARRPQPAAQCPQPAAQRPQPAPLPDDYYATQRRLREERWRREQEIDNRDRLQHLERQRELARSLEQRALERERLERRERQDSSCSIL